MPVILRPSGFLTPMLPSLVDAPPEGDDWLHEIKFDGYRTILAVSPKSALAFTRNGHDWSDRYALVVEAARALKCRSATIDGEMCVQDEAGVTDFAGLRRSIKGAPERLVLFAFDLLTLDGRDIRGEPLIDRRRRLQDLIGQDPASRIQFSHHHTGEGEAFFRAADKAGLEGIVSKRASSRYLAGRTDAWRKVKSFEVGDYAILGVERSSTGIPIALLATLGAEPAYVGNAMVTLSDKERAEFWAAVERLGSPQARLPQLRKRKGATWVSEGMTARVRHLKGEDKLRHATLQSLNVRRPRKGKVEQRHPEEE